MLAESASAAARISAGRWARYGEPFADVPRLATRVGLRRLGSAHTARRGRAVPLSMAAAADGPRSICVAYRARRASRERYCRTCKVAADMISKLSASTKVVPA